MEHIRILYPNGARVFIRTEETKDTSTVITDLEEMKSELRMAVEARPDIAEYVSEDDETCEGMMQVRVKKGGLLLMLKPENGGVRIGFEVYDG